MVVKNQKKAVVIAVFVIFFTGLFVGESRAAQGVLVQSGSILTDSETGLVWPVDAGTPSFGKCAGGKKTWPEAVEYVSCLNTDEYLGYSDWRLPSTDELIRLFNIPAKDNKHKVALEKLKGHGFKILQPSSYWSSAAPTEEIALVVDVVASGYVHPVGKSSTMNVWPVRGGR